MFHLQKVVSIKDQDGLTVIELLMAITILALVLTTAGMIFTGSLKFWAEEQAGMSTGQIGQLVLERMVGHLRMTRAQSVVIEDKRIVFEGKDDGVQTLFAYELGDDEVLRFEKYNSGSDSWFSSPLASSIKELTFSDLDSNPDLHQLIEINFSIEDEKGEIRTFSAKVSPRI